MFCESEAALSTSTTIPIFLKLRFAMVSLQSVVSVCREERASYQLC